MALRRPARLALLALLAMVAFVLLSKDWGDGVLVLLWALTVAGALVAATALGVVAWRVARDARTEAHGAARPWRWWAPVLAAAAAGAAAPLLPLLAGPAYLVRLALLGGHPLLPGLRALLLSLAVAGASALAAAGAGTLAARDGTRTRLGSVLARAALAATVPPALLLAAGWFRGLLLVPLLWGALLGFPLLAARWAHLHRGPREGLARRDAAGYALAAVAVAAASLASRLA